jgi:hypothetical protein
MAEVTYISKFLRVVQLMRKSGRYTATFDSTDVYEIASDVKTFVAVKDYIRLENVPVRVVEVVDYRTFKVKVFEQTIVLAGTWYSLAPYSDFGTRKMIDRKLSVDCIEASSAYHYRWRRFHNGCKHINS